MSRRNLIFLVLFLILVTLFIFFFVYKNKPEPVTPPTDTQATQREEAEKFITEAQPPKKLKTEAQITRELNAFQPPAPGQGPSEEEIIDILNSAKP